MAEHLTPSQNVFLKLLMKLFMAAKTEKYTIMQIMFCQQTTCYMQPALKVLKGFYKMVLSAGNTPAKLEHQEVTEIPDL